MPHVTEIDVYAERRTLTRRSESLLIWLVVTWPHTVILTFTLRVLRTEATNHSFAVHNLDSQH